jgi:DNA-binding HxlR family transcriptional regulator
MNNSDLDQLLEGLSHIDKVIHEPARLLILCHLSVLESADFLFLLRKTGLTRGNLSTHMRRLEKVGYVDVEKKFVERLPLTVYQLTKAGKQALATYHEKMSNGLSVLQRES